MESTDKQHPLLFPVQLQFYMPSAGNLPEYLRRIRALLLQRQRGQTIPGLYPSDRLLYLRKLQQINCHTEESLPGYSPHA